MSDFDPSEPVRSAAQDFDDNIDPQLRGDGAEIKTEQLTGDVHVSLDGFAPGETINVDSDDDDERQASVVPQSEDGLFIPEPTDREKMLAAQRRAAELFRARKANALKANAAISGASKPSDALAHSRSGTSLIDATEIETAASRKIQAAAFAKIKAAYDRKKKAGTNGVEADIEFLKAEAAEEQRLRKIAADLEYDNSESEEDDAAISGAEDYDVSTNNVTAPADDDEIDEEMPPPLGRKRANPDASGSSRKKRKGAQARQDSVDILVKAQKAVAAKAAKGRKKKAPAGKGKKAKDGPRMMNMESVMGTNVVADATATAHMRDQPEFSGTGRRDKALAQMIASVPIEDRKAAGADKRYLDAAIKDFTGYASVRAAADGGWIVNGMKSTLKHYQVMGTAFMRRREAATREPKGGILADQMGLGKTVMMLANIVNGKPKKTTRNRATLLVASAALISQWAQEIEKHTQSNREHKHHGIGWIRNHAGHRLSTSNNVETMEQADIVLTTYQEVMKSYPKAVFPPNLVTAKQKDDWWKDFYEKKKGDFHRVTWFRVVLDEAQAIKNHKSHTSNACRALQSKHNWAITGTPVQNTIAEFYPYLKYVREPTTGTYRIFKENCVTPDDPDGLARLQAYLTKVMIRRTHLDTMFNARLLDLPTPKEHTLWLEFNDVERQIYEIIKKRFIQRINSMAKQGAGAFAKQYSHVWTMVLRLRQICGHILLVQGTVCDLLEREDFEKLNSITANEEEKTDSDEGACLLLHLRNVLSNNASVKSIRGLQGGLTGAVISEGESVPMDLIDAPGSADDTGGLHGHSFHFKKYLQSLVKSKNWEAITQRTTCTGCKQTPIDPVCTSCFHIYCNVCLDDLQHLAARRGHDQARCTECGEAYTSYGPCEGLDDFGRDESTSESLTDATSTKPAKGKKKKSKDGDMEDWIGMKGEMLPSAKTTATKAQILNWLKEDPDNKIIIFTQFLPMVRIMAKICKTEGWSYTQYTGEMSQEARSKAIDDFAESKQIMLASLKSGGLGLNLTMASKVICLDPWWNQSVENQAFCRVFRIGQTKETEFVRFVVNNTIDAAMMAMKERKQIEIEEAMDDSKRRPMTMKDLMRLFSSDVREDGDGNPFIVAEEGDSDEHLRLPNWDEEDEAQIMGNEA